MSLPTTDRNALLGALALRSELVAPEALAEVKAEWERDRSRSLGQILVARGHLREDELPLLDKLVESHLRRQGKEPPTAGTLLTVGTARTLRGHPQTRVPVGESEAPQPELAPKVSRYRVVRPHARGGLGEAFVEIYEATPEQRLVTSIEILSPSNNQPGLAPLQRFVRLGYS
jgi:hypothetical protein